MYINFYLKAGSLLIAGLLAGCKSGEKREQDIAPF